jgi:hypothetical protein
MGKKKNDNCDLATVHGNADAYLYEIAKRTTDIESLRSEYEAAIREVTDQYALRIEAREVLLKSSIAAITQIMKFNKKILFDGTDVVNLLHGSLIHETAKKVTIPKTALKACKENKFNDVIKIVESLDRDAIEKWPDAKLVLIGAERKKKEEFKYTVKTPVKNKCSEV